MKKSDFGTSSPGKLVPIEFIEYPDGPLGDPVTTRTEGFVPAPLPPKLDWAALQVEHFDKYAATVSELGKMNGLHQRVGKAAGLLRTLWMREAKLSSQVENIDTTAEEMVLAGAGRTLGVRSSGKEAWNYVKALEHGVSSDLPWSSRVIREMHSLLLSGVRGDEHRLGELRDCGVYIGDRSHGVSRARFVPMPAGERLKRVLGDLETFVNRKHRNIPPLFVIALTHYQFETIHPFSDGNGRIGRVLISRSLVKEGLLQFPVVYMSAYINEHRQEYVNLLLKISQRGGNYWSRWIGFMLEAIHTQTLDAIWRSEQLIALQQKYYDALKRFLALQRVIALQQKYYDALKREEAPARLFHIIDELFSLPAINVSELAEKAEVRKPTARKDIECLERLGVLTEYTGKQRDRDWVAREIIDVIEKEAY